MRCPICQKSVKLTDSAAPFCSDRCRTIDLGNWASDKYVISTPIHQPVEGGHLKSDDDDGE